MDLGALLESAEQHHGRKVAWIDGTRSLDYGAFADQSRRIAAWLASQGVARGDRIASLEANTIAHAELYFAAALAGAVLCPLNWRLAAPELAAILADCEPKVLFCDPQFADRCGRASSGAPAPAVAWTRAPAQRCAEPVLSELLSSSACAGGDGPRTACRADELAQIYYTSGSTGRPKGVMLTHGNVLAHAWAAVGELALTDGDTWGHFAPLFHLADAWAVFAITAAGGRHAFLPRFEPEECLATIARQRVSATNLVPTMLNLMVKHPRAREHDLSSMRLVMSGGAPIALEVVRQVIALFGCEYVNTYGMTETSPYLTLSLLAEHLRRLPYSEQLRYRARTGRPFAAVELRVVGEDGRDVPRDDRAVGEVRVRGATVTPGYWRQPEATAAAFADGWLLTGDLATIDVEGYVQIVDRRKDMIIRGGENVYSTEVENALYEHPAILEAAVYGVPEPLWGEEVRAAVVLRPGSGAAPDELAEHCRARLAGYKVPRHFEFLAELPRTGSGKIKKQALRERA